MGSDGQHAAEAIYHFLQDQRRASGKEISKDVKLATLVAFTEITGRSIGFLLDGSGPEWPGEARPRTELARDVASVLNRVVPEKLRKIGIQVDGTSAVALMIIKVKSIAETLEPLVAIGERLNSRFSIDFEDKDLVDALEAASRRALAESPMLFTIQGMDLLRATIRASGRSHPNAGLRPIFEDSHRIAQLNAEADLKRSEAVDTIE